MARRHEGVTVLQWFQGLGAKPFIHGWNFWVFAMRNQAAVSAEEASFKHPIEVSVSRV